MQASARSASCASSSRRVVSSVLPSLLPRSLSSLPGSSEGKVNPGCRSARAGIHTSAGFHESAGVDLRPTSPSKTVKHSSFVSSTGKTTGSSVDRARAIHRDARRCTRRPWTASSPHLSAPRAVGHRQSHYAAAENSSESEQAAVDSQAGGNPQGPRVRSTESAQEDKEERLRSILTQASGNVANNNIATTADNRNNNNNDSSSNDNNSEHSPKETQMLSALEALRSKQLSHHRLEELFEDKQDAVQVRRAHIESELAPAGRSLSGIPYGAFDYKDFYGHVDGTNCENVIGYIPLPVGVVGPLRVDGADLHVPLATTEGALLASVNRGARALHLSGGTRTSLMRDGMTRAPVVALPSAAAAVELQRWTELPENLQTLQDAFSSTSRFGRLSQLRVSVAGRNAFLRFECFTGDAMGMNMVSKGVDAAMDVLQSTFPSMRLVSISGNLCTDKKPSAVNWLLGRGKSVCAEATLKAWVVRDVLKTSAEELVDLCLRKNLIGSSMAGSIGGWNAHSANVVTALYLATGQDPAQNVESSNCMTLMERPMPRAPSGTPATGPSGGGGNGSGNAGGARATAAEEDQGEEGDLHVSVTMPSVEVGTVGGGTSLRAQAAALEMLGLRGASREDPPGTNAQRLARVVAATVLAGEVSLMSALASGHLVRAHMQLGRK